MVWYESLRRDQPYIKNFRRWNLWYDFNNPKHQEIRRLKMTWFEHWIKRICKHEAYARFSLAFLGVPLFIFLNKSRKRFMKDPEPEPVIYSGAQYVAAIGRNQFGFETRATKSFEHALSVLLGNEIMSHIFNADSDPFRAEQIGDDDQGLSGDLSEEDILDLYREKKHEPHLGVVYRNPQYHYLNDAPSDILTPYKVVGEKLPQKAHHEHGHGHH